MQFSSPLHVLSAICLFSVVWSTNVRAESRLTISHAALERLIVSSALTEGGRRYFQGDPEDDCAYAFVQEPRVSARAERLVIRFLFAGRAGRVIAGRCVGAGDNFDVLASGFPRYEPATGEIVLDDLDIEAESHAFELFALLIRSQLGELLRMPFRQTIERNLEALAPTTGARVELENVTVAEIAVEEEALQLTMDLQMTIEP